MRRVERGESFTVTRNGQPVGWLAPIDAGDAADPFVAVDALVETASALPPVDGDRFRRDLNAVVDASIEA